MGKAVSLKTLPLSPILPMDGAKYPYNKHEILAREQNCLEYVVGEVTGTRKRWFDFRELEYYPG